MPWIDVPSAALPLMRYATPLTTVLVSRRKADGYCVAIMSPHDGMWQGKQYAIKQVPPVIKEELEEGVVVTVYTFFV